MLQRLDRRTVLKTVGSGALATGFASTAAAETTSTVVVDGRNAEDGIGYSLLVTGEITGKSTANGASVNGNDRTTTDGAWGFLRGGQDAYEFTGELAGFRSDGDPAVRVDGDPADPPSPSVVRVANESSSRAVQYDLSVSGSLVKAAGDGASVNSSDSLSGDAVSGEVWDGADRYAFVGEISALSSTGDLAVYVDGVKQDYAGTWPPETGSGSGDETETASETESRVARIERAIHEEVNARRAEHGLDALSTESALDTAAREYSQSMAERDFFSHTAPGDDSFSEHYRDDGVDCTGLGENILMRTVRADSAEAVAANAVEQWMNSSGHRRNILRESWTADGVGVAFDGDGGLYATQGFGYGCE